MKFLLLSILYVSISYSQSNYWEYHSLDNCTQLVKTDNEVFYAASYPALLKSADYGISWDTIYTSNNLCEGSRFTIFVDTNYIPDDRIIVMQSRNGCPTYFNISTDGGNSWNSLTNMPGGSASLTFTSQGNIYYMGVNILYSSSDNGETWNIVYDFPNPPWAGYIDGLVSDIYDNLYTTFGYDWEVSPGIFDGTRVGMQSTNFGLSWLTVFPGVIMNEWVPDMTLVSTATGDVFAYTFYYTFLHFNGSTTYEYSLEVRVNSVLVNNLDHIYCSGGAFVYSTDQGNSWVTDTSGISGFGYNPSSVVIDTLGILYVSTNDGIFRSNFTTFFFFDSLVQFQETPTEDTTYQNVIMRNHFSYDVLIDSITISIPEFYISESYNNIISANDSINIVVGFTPDEIQQYESEIILYSEFIRSRTMLSGTGVNATDVEASQIIVDDFVLKQNYPNPFNSQTTIEYIVPERSHIQIIVYDYLGRIVQILFDGIEEEGKYKINFNAHNIASGIYFYRMQARNFTAARKLILLK